MHLYFEVHPQQNGQMIELRFASGPDKTQLRNGGALYMDAITWAVFSRMLQMGMRYVGWVKVDILDKTTRH